ncbi:hypothetical protein [Comamonas endophytica]|uniref:PsiF repeat-containing protein n=1 Tax=Comamonas endophytica TaxID=2949090 RepID=A0ABY6GCH4_9BURK|nr:MULTISPECIES: hypothetical protein [unclassified Acidovorax]MCD2513581.1 hypothetical protein [Acidovorax sp. D4N7]UYG52410.1 hypothetical protein M9799_03975 [Acidovorax sp. 5MLIR]
MRFPMLPPAMVLALLCCTAANAAQSATARGASATQAGGDPVTAARPPTRASQRKPRIVHLPSPSEESTQQRDRRLARECRGLPNAGACLGHALARPRAASGRR